MGELVASNNRANRVTFNLHIILSMPFPRCLSAGSHLTQIVAVYYAVVLSTGHAAFYPSRVLAAHWLPGEIDGVSIVPTAKVVMLVVIAIFPEDFSIPVIFT